MNTVLAGGDGCFASCAKGVSGHVLVCAEKSVNATFVKFLQYSVPTKDLIRVC